MLGQKEIISPIETLELSVLQIYGKTVLGEELYLGKRSNLDCSTFARIGKRINYFPQIAVEIFLLKSDNRAFGVGVWENGTGLTTGRNRIKDILLYLNDGSVLEGNSGI